MKDIKQKVKNYREIVEANVNVIDRGDLNKRIFQFLLSAIIFCSVLYLFILSTLVFNGVEKRKMESFLNNLSVEINNLEAEYLVSSSNLNLAISEEMGFKEIKAKFVTKGTTKLTMAQNEF